MRGRTTFGFTLIKTLLWCCCAIVYIISFNALKGSGDTTGMLIDIVIAALSLLMCLLNAKKLPYLWEARKQAKAPGTGE